MREDQHDGYPKGDDSEPAKHGSQQRVVRRRPTKPSETWDLGNGAILHLDRRIMPIMQTCCQCGKRKADCAPDEGDSGWWCLDCIEAWEKKTQTNWEDGTPLKPSNEKAHR